MWKWQKFLTYSSNRPFMVSILFRNQWETGNILKEDCSTLTRTRSTQDTCTFIDQQVLKEISLERFFKHLHTVQCTCTCRPTLCKYHTWFTSSEDCCCFDHVLICPSLLAFHGIIISLRLSVSLGQVPGYMFTILSKEKKKYCSTTLMSTLGYTCRSAKSCSSQTTKLL